MTVSILVNNQKLKEDTPKEKKVVATIGVSMAKGLSESGISEDNQTVQQRKRIESSRYYEKSLMSYLSIQELMTPQTTNQRKRRDIGTSLTIQRSKT